MEISAEKIFFAMNLSISLAPPPKNQHYHNSNKRCTYWGSCTCCRYCRRCCCWRCCGSYSWCCSLC